MRLYPAIFISKTPSTHAAELDLLQQRKRRAPRRFWAQGYGFLGEVGYLWERLMFPLFWEAYVSSNVSKIKKNAILNEVPPVISALKLNAGQRWGSYLWLARTRKKTRRQLVHCRIDVLTTRRNVVVNLSYIVQKLTDNPCAVV